MRLRVGLWSVRLYMNVVFEFASDFEARDGLFRVLEVAVDSQTTVHK